MQSKGVGALKLKNDIWAQRNEALLGLVIPPPALQAVLACPTGALRRIQMELGAVCSTKIGMELFGDLHCEILHEIVDGCIREVAEDLVAEQEITEALFKGRARGCEERTLAIPKVDKLEDRRKVLCRPHTPEH